MLLHHPNKPSLIICKLCTIVLKSSWDHADALLDGSAEWLLLSLLNKIKKITVQRKQLIMSH